MNIKAAKTRLRREVIARILAMDPASRRSEEAALVARFAELPGVLEARTILLYASAFPEEFNTRPILLKALELGKQLVLPRVDPTSRSLHLLRVADLDHDLTLGHRGIPEPSSQCSRVDPSAIDWVLVPGLAFNRQGFRLGRGAGHYDRLLPTLRLDAPRWALILEPQWVEDLPIEPHDQPLDGLADHREVVLRP